MSWSTSLGCRNGESHWVKRSSTHLAHPLTQGRHCQTSTRGSANGTHDVPCVGRYSGAGCEIGHARVFRYCREKGKAQLTRENLIAGHGPNVPLRSRIDAQ